MKVKEYYVVEGHEWIDVVNGVNDYIKKGYTPQGGVTKVFDDQGNVSYLQAMVLPE